jgi:hypothetical protein
MVYGFLDDPELEKSNAIIPNSQAKNLIPWLFLLGAMIARISESDSMTKSVGHPLSIDSLSSTFGNLPIRIVLRQAITRETPARMNFIGKDAALDARVAVHDLYYFFTNPARTIKRSVFTFRSQLQKLPLNTTPPERIIQNSV